MKAKKMIYFPQQSKYWPRWADKDLPSVTIHYDQSHFGSTFITGVQMGNRELIQFTGTAFELFTECRDLVRQLEEKKPLPDYAALVPDEELENGEAEREAEEKRVNDFYENELLID